MSKQVEAQVEAKSTPGPWLVASGNFITADHRDGDPETGVIVAEVPCCGGNSADLPLLANAWRLPILYDQLCNIQARIRGVREDYRGFNLYAFDERMNAIESLLGDVIAEIRGEQ